MNKLFKTGDILIPENANMELWSVIACDQFTSSPEYWDSLGQRVGEKPSTLKLIFPEAYLGTKNGDEETKKINAEMEKYLSEGVFKTIENSYIYVERDMTVGEKRRGLLGVVDLENYDYKANSTSPIHATEGTIEERLPPRVKVREGASLELPHIVVFIDDPENKVFDSIKCNETLYDFDLVDGGGHIIGKRVCGENAEVVDRTLGELFDTENLKKRYNLKDKHPISIAMGDGNHSLATAKLCWENLKPSLSEEERATSPKRFSLVELVNIHDKSIGFEPIHRVLFNTKVEGVKDAMKAYFEKNSDNYDSCHEVKIYIEGQGETLKIKGNTIGGLIGKVQKFLEEYAESNGGKIDYIHDDQTTIDFSMEENAVSVLLPTMGKDELFTSTMESGVFPAKSFSIGPARDKRYYLECRKIK